jgi:predicted O-linked N-acetylglucosamine transferase (SPINDLY family)
MSKMAMLRQQSVPDQSREDLPLLLDVSARARRRQLSLTELFQAADDLKRLGHSREVPEIYKLWIAYNSDSSLVHFAYFNYAVALRELDDLAGAINALHACLRVDPSFGPAHINLGRAFEDIGQSAFALKQWRTLLDATAGITPERAAHRLMALQHIGRVSEHAELLQDAEVALRQAMELRPDRTEAGQHWIALRQRQCKWPVLEASEHVSVRQLLDAMSPMAFAVYADDPMFQLAKAYRYSKATGSNAALPPFQCRVKNKTGTGARLRIGYVSSDLRAHAVGFALSEVLELHDKKTIETFAYYCGEDKLEDLTQRRIRSAVDHWRDILRLTEQEAAERIAKDEIDILVDVNGYTKHARPRIFSFRPAPIIVNWCGYPGTMGSPYHHYVIADERIVPPSSERYYSEKVMRIQCNQPIDRKRVVERPLPTREQAGLPEDRFVYACFNGTQKLTPRCFARWLKIMQGVPASILWLLAGEDDTNQRLRALAAAGGVAPERILFAAKAPPPRHLARIGLADLFLDTLPYGAHSTAADALTMGLPVLTLAGKSFAARFCSSVVAAAGLDDLICASADEYVQRAIAFGRNPESLRYYRDRLARSRESSVLFDIPGLVRGLEACFWEMQSAGEQGRTPVPDLTNLDHYYEIGAELDLEGMESVSELEYEKLYRDKLAVRNMHQSLPTDQRFWRRELRRNADSDVR